MVRLEEDVKRYIRARFNEGMTIMQIVAGVEKDCMEKTSYSTVNKYLHEAGLLGRNPKLADGQEARNRDRNLASNAKLIAFFKTAEKGDEIEYVETGEWSGGTYTPTNDALRKRTATVIKCYPTYIHTSSGCIQYVDVRRLIKRA